MTMCVYVCARVYTYEINYPPLTPSTVMEKTQTELFELKSQFDQNLQAKVDEMDIVLNDMDIATEVTPTSTLSVCLVLTLSICVCIDS